MYFRAVNIKDWSVSVEYEIAIPYIWSMTRPIQYDFNNFTLHAGILFDQTGESPETRMYDFFLYEGDSKLYLGDDWIL